MFNDRGVLLQCGSQKRYPTFIHETNPPSAHLGFELVTLNQEDLFF